MLLRRIAGLLLAAVAGWLLWGGIHTVNLIVARGSPLADALFQPPTSIMRIAGTGLAVLGGLLAFLRAPFGAVIGIIGVAIFVLLAATMALSGAESVLWMDEVIYSVILVVLAAAILVMHRD